MSEDTLYAVKVVLYTLLVVGSFIGGIIRYYEIQQEKKK